MSAGNLFNSNSATSVKTALAGDNTTETLFKTNIQYVVDEVASNYSRLETAEPKITTLQTDLDTLETTVGNLSSPTIPPNGVTHAAFNNVSYISSPKTSSNWSYSSPVASFNNLPFKSSSPQSGISTAQYALINVTLGMRTTDPTGNGNWKFKITTNFGTAYEETGIYQVPAVLGGSFIAAAGGSDLDLNLYWDTDSTSTSLVFASVSAVIFEDWESISSYL